MSDSQAQEIISEAIKIVAVVVTYNRPNELREVIAGLLTQSRAVDLIIIIDNAGPELASSVLKDFHGPIHIYRNDHNTGGAGGFSQGLARGLAWGADWIWLLDDDAVPQPEALACLLAGNQELNISIGALCCSVREYGDLALRHRRKFCRWTGWERSLKRKKYTEPYAEIDIGSFVGFLLSSSAIRSVGLPDGNFFIAYDDTDYSLLLRQSGWRLLLIPSSVVNHLRSPNSRLHSSNFSDKHYFNIRNRLIVKRRYSRFRHLASFDGIFYAIILWLITKGWMHLHGWRLLISALEHGISGNLNARPPGWIEVTNPIYERANQVFPEKPRGVAIVRTQGRRLEMLTEALASIAVQAPPVSALVVVHGGDQELALVQNAILGAYPGLEVLHAPDTRRKRGYPINLALEHIYTAADKYDFLFFLDDDDIIYKDFSEKVTEVFRKYQADLVYAASNKKSLSGELSLGYSPLPAACLLSENFVPINSYAVRLAALRYDKPFFNDSLEVLEDWNFLHRLLALQLRFVPLPEVLSEFRLTGDGNSPDKVDQALWDRAWEEVQANLRCLRETLDPKYILGSFTEFDFASRTPLTPKEISLLQKTEDLLGKYYPDSVTVRPSPA